MILPDVNVLIYAFRSDSLDHPRYHRWLEDVVNGQEAYGIAPQALASLIRIATNPKIFVQPSKREEAFAFANLLLAQPNAVKVSPGDRHWEIFERLCRGAKAAGNLVQDAWFAALAIESGSEWITTDRDYARFAGLKWRPPW